MTELCECCGKRVALRSDGALRGHIFAPGSGGWCAGSHRQPRCGTCGYLASRCTCIPHVLRAATPAPEPQPIRLRSPRIAARVAAHLMASLPAAAAEGDAT